MHMDLFEHLSLIPFLLVALGLIKIISAIAHYIETSNKFRESEVTPIKLYWVHTLFITGCFFALMLYWWNSYQFNDYSSSENRLWTFGEYMLYMTPGIFLYLALEIAIPELKGDEPIDLKEHYYSNSVEMWATIAGVTSSSVIFSLLLYGNEVTSPSTLGRLVLLFILIPMCFTRNEKVHRAAILIFCLAMAYSVPESWSLQNVSS